VKLECPTCKKEPVTVSVEYICQDGHKWKELVDLPNHPDPPAPDPTPDNQRTGMRMPFGKYKGMFLEDLPSDYIVWCLGSLADLREPLKTELDNQLRLRRGEGVARSKIEGRKFRF
jgi:hypothetical protein